MLKWILIVLTLVVAVVAVPVGYIAYQFYQSGDDYGEALQKSDPQTLRTTIYGEVVGFLDETDTHTWMGIPFAAAPVENLRWRAPVIPHSWDGVRDALQAGNRCKQIGSFGESRPPGEFGKPIGSEDCLYLNIFAPKFPRRELPAGTAGLPVMVYIHGGGNTAGYANQFKYSGRNLAKNHNVIVVTLNYRLGLFGWFAHPSLNRDGSAEDRSGNYGNLDTVMALQWVQDNIQAFGGNPDNVTLFGESAGGMNVFALLASPGGKGLFHKAIVQSGLPVSTPMAIAQNYVDDSGHENSAREITSRFLMADGLATSRADAVTRQNVMSEEALSAYLRGKSADEILGIYDAGTMVGVPMIFRDGSVVPTMSLMQVFADAARYNAVPIIIGTNRDEFKMMFAGNADLVALDMGFLPRIIDETHFNAVTGYFNDSWKAKGVDEVSIRLQQSQDAPVFAYRFDWDELPEILGVDLAKLMGAAHAAEIPFVFGSFDDRFMNSLMFTDENIPSRDALSRKMSSYWAEFAYTGSPGKGRNGDLPDWGAWNSAPGHGKFVMLDSEDGGGIRMNNQAVTFAVLKERLMHDPAFPDASAKSRIYDCVFRESTLWDEDEFQGLGGKRCEIPVFEFLRL